MVGEIRGALDNQPREALVEILTYVFKEYVVEGAAPLASGAGAILDARTELEGMTFAQVVQWLQTHLDLPELRLLEVAGDRVSVRHGGRVVPIEPQAAPEPAAPAPRSPSVTQAIVQPMPITQTPSVMTSPPPTPANSPAVQQSPAAPLQNSNSPAAQQNAANSPATQQNPAQPAAPASDKDKAQPSGDASGRFSLLEVD